MTTALDRAMAAWDMASIAQHVPANLLRVLQYPGAGVATINLGTPVTVTCGYDAVSPAQSVEVWRQILDLHTQHTTQPGVALIVHADLHAPVQQIEWTSGTDRIVITRADTAVPAHLRLALLREMEAAS